MEKNFIYNEQINDSANKQRKQELVEMILERNNGTTISLKEIGEVLKLNINLEEDLVKLKRIMSSLKNYLISKGKLLKSIGGIGYYILKPSEYSSHCYRTYVKGSMRMLDKSYFVLDNADTYEMSIERQTELEDMKKLNKELQDKMWETVKESGYYNRMTYYQNLKD